MKINFKKLSLFLVPFIVLLILFLTFYPGIFTPDSEVQWGQVSSSLINNAHPFLSTYFWYLIYKVLPFKSCLIIFQMIFITLLWGSICLNFYNEYENSYKKILIYDVIFFVLPIIGIFTITAWKDVIYSYCLLFILYYIYLGIKNNFKYSSFQYFVIGILFFFVYNFRINGIICAIILLLFFYVIILKNKGKKNLCSSIILLFTFVIMTCFLSFPKNYYIEQYNKVNSNVNDESSVNGKDIYMTWIMGAHLNADYVSQEDLDFLNNYIEIDEWKNAYSPFLINDVASTSSFNGVFFNENSSKIWKLFIKYSLKHPLTIVKHFYYSTSMIWSPIRLGYVYVFGIVDWIFPYSFNVLDTSVFKVFNVAYEFCMSVSMKFPFNFFYMPAIPMYLSLIICYLLVKVKKNKRYWLLCLPMLCNSLSLFPLIIAQDLRYLYINYLTFGFVFLLFIINYSSIINYLKVKKINKKVVKKRRLIKNKFLNKNNKKTK